MSHKTPPPYTCTEGGHGWCCGWKGGKVPNFSTQLPSSSHEGCYTSLEDFPRCLVHAIRNFPPPNTLPAAATLPTVLFPGIWASPKPCCRNTPHAGHCLPHLGTMSGAMGPEMEIWARPHWLTCLIPAPGPGTAPNPQQTLAPFPSSKATPGTICQAEEGEMEPEPLPSRRCLSTGGAASASPARAAFLPSPGGPQFSVCTSAHVLQEPPPLAKRLQMLEELCTAAGQQQQRGKYK